MSAKIVSKRLKVEAPRERLKVEVPGKTDVAAKSERNMLRFLQNFCKGEKSINYHHACLKVEALLVDV